MNPLGFIIIIESIRKLRSITK